MNYFQRHFNRIFAAFVVALLFGAGGVLAQVDVPRKTVAVTYPLGENVNVLFQGTTRFPRLKGSARVQRKNKTGTKVDISMENLPRPYELGAAYTTYVLWAITPEGQVDRLGEVKFRSGTVLQNPRLEVTTPLQTFALIVTAEPHYLVKEPSRAVILENLTPGAGTANVVNVQYFGNSSDYFRDSRVPEIAAGDYIRTPVSLQGARQAVNMAKFAGAERDAEVEFEYAVKSLEQAETAWKGAQQEDQVDVLSRQAIAAGVRAEEVAGSRKAAREQRNVKARSDAEITRAEDRVAEAQRERDDLKAELERERRSRELGERDVDNSLKQIADLKRENQTLREELARVRTEAEDAKIKLARAEGERETIEKQKAVDQKREQIRTSAPLLMQSLKQFGAVSETSRGIVLVLPENLWANSREAGLTVAADAKLQRLAEILGSNADYQIGVEAHTDDGGSAEILLNLTNDRARIISEKLIGAGLDSNRLKSEGFGGSVPVAANTTNANRAKNRRVEIVLAVSEN